MELLDQRFDAHVDPALGVAEGDGVGRVGGDQVAEAGLRLLHDLLEPLLNLLLEGLPACEDLCAHRGYALSETCWLQ